MEDLITYQMATHFLPRAALRIESLYATIANASTENHPVIHHYALNNLIEIMKLVEKPELKSRFLKEMIRIEHLLLKTQHKLPAPLQQKIDYQIQVLSAQSGAFCTELMQDLFLQSVRNHQQPDSELYLPQLLFWLENTPSVRLQDIQRWLEHLRLLRDTVAVYLGLLRAIMHHETIHLPNGFYQQFIPPKMSCHLIIFGASRTSHIVPKLQYGHHGISIRLYHAHTMQELSSCDSAFTLGLCQI